ncbi:MAG TPA: hypothetical protein VNM22_11965 [Candidatus Limnocylindrales bacterium]|nr:hypothetical protein [Candidatus Limnocylindrales bacterium]
MDEINKKTRKRIAELVTDQEAADTQLSGDFDSEGILDYFRRAEIWVPTEVYADFVMSTDLDWYGMQFNVAFVPPEKQKVSWAHVRLDFQELVKQLGAWLPNDVFSAYKEVSKSTDIKGTVSLGVPEALLVDLPYLKDVLPQFSVGYRKFAEEKKSLTEGVIRAFSDRQRRLGYDLSEDPKTGVDQRQLVAQVLFGVAPGSNLMESLPLVSLTINCRCGPLRLKSEIYQDVDATFRRRP